MLEEKNNIKVAFIHGRPSGHPIHVEYAKLLDADFFYEDRILKWLDGKSSKIRRYTSWILNAFFFPKKNSYKVYFCECLRIPPLIMKTFGILNSKQKLIALMADESLYFLDNNKYPKATEYLLKLFLRKCDGVICIGDLQYELARKYIKVSQHHKIVKIYNGINSNYIKELNNVKRKKDNVIRFFVVANLGADWRVWYKGVDVAFDAFSAISMQHQNVELYVVGEVIEEVKEKLTSKISLDLSSKIIFTGSINNLPTLLTDFDLCIHVSRGDAFPTSSIECLMAGIPVLVSNHTGTKSIVESIDARFVISVDAKEAVSAMNYFMNLNSESKMQLSEKCRLISSKLNSLEANNDFCSKFYSFI